jgi:2-keto-4-pentenoate hydratase/2-oxohepta-3-ene-1,7-dioic acid hydratase in catechol pathway
VRIVRFAHPNGFAFGVLEGDGPAGVIREVVDHPFGEHTYSGRQFALADVRLLAPVLPTKVVCIGKNYADHVKEMGGDTPPAAPILFIKPSTSVIGPNDPIRRPPDSERVDYEGELAAVIGAVVRRVPPSKALAGVLGFTCANDVTARDQQAADGQWTRGKGHDSFCPIGPWIETELDPSDVTIQTELDDELRQNSRTSLLLHDVPTLISYISQVMTLLPGDVVLTGTPAGVGPMVAGQQVSVTVEGIGTLTNPVVDL